MKDKYLLLFLFFAGFTLSSNAQVAAPDLICISNDTLVWETPVNSCGAFIGYEIYASQNPNGPYTLLTTLTNPNQTSYFHAGVSGMDWYYYMQTSANCPGQPVLSSDTLDNRIPEAGPLQFVTVNGTQVEVAWGASPSPEVIAYVISRNTMSGTTILDTIYTGSPLVYVDALASPDVASQVYFAVSLDACGNKSLVTPPHNTIFLTANAGNGCDAHISLEWNAYQNWIGGVEAYEIWVTVNGGTPGRIAELPGNTLTYDVTSVNDQDTYCFFVRARQTGTAVVSNSNVTCVTPHVVQAVRDLLMENAGYTSTGNIAWEWSWNTEAAIQSATIQQGTTASGNFEDISNFPIPPTLTAVNTLLSGDMPLLPDYYRVMTVDSCGRITTSNPVRPPRLQGIAAEGSMNSLSWSAYVNDSASVVSYEVYRIGPAGESLLATLSGATLEYVDALDFSDSDPGSYCYYVVAVVEIPRPDGSGKPGLSRSNTICLEQVPNMFVPNAFAPEGINNTFRPFLQFGEPAQYRMAIYDRWGGEVFVSTELSKGWDGKKKGRPMPQGVYIYHIRVEQVSGNVIERKGSVALLR